MFRSVAIRLCSAYKFSLRKNKDDETSQTECEETHRGFRQALSPRRRSLEKNRCDPGSLHCVSSCPPPLFFKVTFNSRPVRRESLFTERCYISTLGSADLARKGTAGEIAEAEHVTRSVVTRLLRLLPSRRVVEAILECRQPKSDAVAGADAGDAERMGGAAGSLRLLG